MEVFVFVGVGGWCSSYDCRKTNFRLKMKAFEKARAPQNEAF